jgi:hypothetical protein
MSTSHGTTPVFIMATMRRTIIYPVRPIVIGGTPMMINRSSLRNVSMIRQRLSIPMVIIMIVHHMRIIIPTPVHIIQNGTVNIIRSAITNNNINLI